jgi:hypothetical protein
MSQIEDIRQALVGQFFWRFAVSDGFDLYFDNFVLSSRAISSLSEDPSFHAHSVSRLTANPDLVAKSAVVAACLGVPISGCHVTPESALHVTFSNGVVVRLPTDTPIVDWHWAISERGGDPYSGCYIACFAPGDIQGSMSNNSFKVTPDGAPQLNR